MLDVCTEQMPRLASGLIATAGMPRLWGPETKREKPNTTGSGHKDHNKCGQEILRPNALVLKGLIGDHLLVASPWPSSSTGSSSHLHPAFPDDQVGLLRRKGNSQMTWASTTSLNAVEENEEIPRQRLPYSNSKEIWVDSKMKHHKLYLPYHLQKSKPIYLWL